jgi:hypothetical protein
MSQTPGWERPGEEPADPDGGQPPYPGWSTRQPPTPEWAAPGQSAPDQPAPDQSAPPPESAPPSQSGPQSSETAPARPGWGQPAQPGWSTSTGWGWQQPAAVKPGVIPLRPLGVGEILDGAVTTIRRNPGPMLGLSAIVAIVTQLLGLGIGWWLLDQADEVSLSSTSDPNEVFDALAGFFGAAAVVVIVTWVATVLLTGILTVVVSRAVLGEHQGVGEAWRAARPRLIKLLLLTVLYSLTWIGPFLVAVGLALAVGAASGDGEVGAGFAVILTLAAIPIAIWLYIRYALSGPSLMLESRSVRGGPPRPVGVIGALRRSAELVRRSWWRVFWILLLVLLIAVLIGQVISVPFSWVPYLAVGDDPSDAAVFGTLVLSALGGIVASTFTAPFTAAATALLYVDRRIRREGLDIELARAADVTIPGRTDTPQAPGSP